MIEVSPNSYQAGFAAAGGGVFATQFDVAGYVFRFFFPSCLYGTWMGII